MNIVVTLKVLAVIVLLLKKPDLQGCLLQVHLHGEWKFVSDLEDSGGDRSHDSIMPHSGLGHRSDSRWDVDLQAFGQHHQTR